MIWAILATIFCCLPLGIVSIIKSSQVSGLWAQGRYDDAQKSAQQARKWAIWSAIAAAVLAVISVIIAIIVIVIAAQNGTSTYEY